METFRPHAALYGAELGNLEVLKWARSRKPPCPWYDSTGFAAAQGGHLHVL
jgi:hypothetical protein